MALRACIVAVKSLPEALSMEKGRRFFSELESCMNIDRPLIVLDCSRVRQMDRSAIHVLLCCLEEAMKRNGDVKLAELPAEVKEILKLAGADRLFEIFDTNAEAVKSFF